MPRKKCDCIPAEEGHYWATYNPARSKPYRVLLQLGKDGNGHLRCFVARWSGSANPNEFADYSERIADPKEKK